MNIENKSKFNRWKLKQAIKAYLKKFDVEMSLYIQKYHLLKKVTVEDKDDLMNIYNEIHNEVQSNIDKILIEYSNITDDRLIKWSHSLLSHLENKILNNI